MKYIIVLGDGMADYKLPALGDKTPLQCADKPAIDALAKKAEIGCAARCRRASNPAATLQTSP